MKKVFSVLLCVFSVLVFSSSALFSVSAYAVTSPITWDDVTEDAISLRDSYYKLWSESSNFSELFKNAADIPIKWLTFLADGSAALSPISGLFYYKTETAYKVDYSGVQKGLKQRFDSGDIKPEIPLISSDELIEGIEKDNTDLCPKSTDLFLNSYRTQPYLYDTYLHNGGYDRFTYSRYVLFDNGVDERLKDLYFIQFGLDYDGTYYYLPFQFHFYFDSYDGTNADMALKMEVFIHTPLGYQSYASYTDVLEFNSDNMPYQIAFNAGPTPPTLFVYPDEDSYINQKSLKYNVLSTMSDKELFYTADKSDYKRNSNGAFNNFSYRYDKHIVKGEVMYSGDFGFMCSKSKISTVYDFDTSKIGKGQVVTINGDTIYNYTITNPETGDSSKFGDYITNNYTYITNNNGGSSGGTVGGNVIVDGNIDVSGSVGVDINVSVPDININVNGNGSGAGESVSLPDTDLVENLPEAPSGFIDYTASLFSFLPAEILSLLIAGLAAAIFCRIWGR